MLPRDQPLHTRAADQVVDLPLGFRAAELAPSTFNAADFTLDVVFTGGAIVRRAGEWMDGPYNEELIVSANAVRLDRLNAGAPLLNTHDGTNLNSVIGSVVPGSARIERGQGVAKVQLSQAPADADIVKKIRDGVIRNISVGYVRHQIEKIETDGALPLWRVVDWEPYEISAVPVPADAAAQFRAGSKLYVCRVQPMNGPAAQARAQMAAARQRLSASAPLSLAGDYVSRARAEMAAARQRVSATTSSPPIAAPVHQPLKKIKPLKEHPMMRTIAMSAAIAARMARAAGDRSATIPDYARPYGEMSLVEIAAEAIGYRGRLRVGHEINQVFDRAFLSTSDFPGIFSTALNARLLSRYQLAQPTYRLFCAPYTATDFRTMNVVRIGDLPEPQRIPETGFIPAGSFSESKEQLTVFPYGSRVNVSRQMLIDDNLGAIDQMLSSYSDVVLNWENNMAFEALISNSYTGPTLLSDSTVMFHTNHGNETSAGTAISIASVGDGRAKMMKQTGINGKLLNLQPVSIVAGPDRLTEAEQLVATINPTLIASAPTDWMKRLRPAGDGNIAGNHWYLFADPASAPCFVYGMLQGFEGPRVSVDAPFQVQGIEVKLEHDFGIGGVDYRGGVHNAGAAPA